MKLTWFTHEKLSLEEAQNLILSYTARNIKTEKAPRRRLQVLDGFGIAARNQIRTDPKQALGTADMEQSMIIIQMGFGLSIKRGHMFGDKKSQRKMISIKLPILSIYVLNKKATEYWYEVGRYAFNDPNWFIENHHAVRQAKRKAMVRKHQAWCAAHDEVRADYQKRLDELQQRSADQSRVIREQSRDIEAYRKLVGATDGR